MTDLIQINRISDKLVKLKVNHKLIKFVIDWQLNHSKPRTAKTKQRNQIKGSTKNSSTKVEMGQDTRVKKHHYLLWRRNTWSKKTVYKTKKINKKVKNLALAQTLSRKF